MFGKGRGGIEQSFLDYSRALVGSGQRVTSLVHPGAAILPMLNHYQLPVTTLANWGVWDPIACYRLTQLIRTNKPDIIIAHGGRAASLLKKATQGKVPVVGVCHNPSIRRLLGCDALFTVTEALKQAVIKAGQPTNSVYTMPNMVSLPDTAPILPKPRHRPLVIGTLGRFVAKKGFRDFIAALHLLHNKGIAFQAILAGDGEERQALVSQAKDMEAILSFPGWVTDKPAFFDAIDIFCLPSLEEPFGIVLLEAFQHGVPVVSTECEGPLEIITHGHDGLLTARNKPEALAASLENMINDTTLAEKLASNAYDTVRSRYAMPVVAERMVSILETVCDRHCEEA